MTPDQWREIPGYEGLYEVSNYGAVRALPRSGSAGRELKQHEHKGYRRVCLSKNNVRRHWPVHCLVARAFIPNPENKPFVNHKDGNKRNNTVANLEWCTAKENQKHSREVLGNTHTGERNPNYGYRKAHFFPSQELRNRLVELGVPRNKHDIVTLGEMLPCEIENDWLRCIKSRNDYGTVWKVRYAPVGHEAEYKYQENADTEADARAKMLIYLLENKLITV